MVHDITERKRREEELHRLNRTLKALSSSDQAMLRATNEADYVQAVCDIVIGECGHAMAWVGYAENDQEKTVRPVAQAGFDEGYVESLHVTWADTKRGRGPTGTAIRTARPTVCRNMLTDPQFEPWRAEALKRGYASSVVLPLMAGDTACGAMTIYSRDPDPFTVEEIRLLTDLVDDLAYGIHAIRLRAAHAAAEDELRQAAEQRRLVLQAADLGAWDYRFDEGQVFWDDRCREIFGVARGDRIGYETVLGVMHPEDRTRVDQAVQAALAGEDGGAYQREFRVVWGDGSVHWVASYGRAYFEGEGSERRAVRFIGVSMDIGERRRAEETRAHLAAIVESSDDAILSKGLDGKINSWNVGAERLFGYRSEEIVGKPISVLLPADRIHEEEQIVGQFLRGERVEHMETVRVSKDGRPIDVSVSVSPLRDAEGRVIGASKIIRDITERKRAEQALQAITEDLRRSNQDLEQFAYVASHDLQEPLRMVTGYLQLIERRYKQNLDQNGMEFIDFAVDGATRMSRLITDLLDYSRVGTRGKPLVPVDTEKVLTRAVGNLGAAIADTGAEITHDPLPTVKGDSTQLTQLFQNLIGNAIKFRSPTKLCKVHVSAQREGQQWVFRVADNGIGIDPQYAQKIFLIFQRLHGRQQYPGTGIGLAICKKIVERHGGRMWVNGCVGEGSTFLFTLEGE